MNKFNGRYIITVEYARARYELELDILYLLREAHTQVHVYTQYTNTRTTQRSNDVVKFSRYLSGIPWTLVSSVDAYTRLVKYDTIRHPTHVKIN